MSPRRYLTISLSVLEASALAVPSVWHEQELLSAQSSHRLPAVSATVRLPIDHFNASDQRTYGNRYWFNDTFYEPGGPVLFYDGGERGFPLGLVPSVFYENHPVTSLAKRFNALVVAWEHRFYGLSTPFPELNVTSAPREMEEAFRYLNTEQALEDTVAFAHDFRPPGLENVWEALQPNATPWIWIGGSYAGQRAVMIRERNPEIFWASWSSSAPIQVALDFPEYHLQISRDLPNQCREVIQRAIKCVDEVLLRGSRSQRIKLRWEIVKRWDEGKSWREKVNFMAFAPDFVVAEWFERVIAFDWQWRGMNGGMNETCRRLTQGSDDRADDLDAHVKAVLDAIKASQNDSHRPEDPFSFPMDELAWRYQVSTEYPYLRTADPSSNLNILSSLLDFNTTWFYHHEQSFPWIKSPPDMSTSVPAKYAGWNVELPERVMIMSGLRDPWHQLGALPVDSLVPGAPGNRTVREVVPNCGEKLAEDEVFGLVMEKGSHCVDLVAGTHEALRATELFAEALKVWLPCFSNQTSPRRADL